MRSLILAVVASLLVAVPAEAAEYRRLPGPPMDVGFQLQRGKLLVGAGGVVTEHRLDGSTRRVALPKTRGELRGLRASDQAIAVEMSQTNYAALTGKRWRKLGGLLVSGDVNGSYALVTRRNEFDEGGSLEVINLRTGVRRHFRIGQDRPVGAQIVGDYLAYIVDFATTSRETLIVRRLSTGRQVYRHRLGSFSDYHLLPGGRVVVVQAGTYQGAYFIRIGASRLRTIREVALKSSQVEVAGNRIAMIRSDAMYRGDVWLMGFDGKWRPVTGRIPGMDRIVFDGKRLAFNVEGCVFFGTIPAPGAPFPGVSADGCVRS